MSLTPGSCLGCERNYKALAKGNNENWTDACFLQCWNEIFLFIHDSPWYYLNPLFTENVEVTNTVLVNKMKILSWLYGIPTTWSYQYHRNTFTQENNFGWAVYKWNSKRLLYLYQLERWIILFNIKIEKRDGRIYISYRPTNAILKEYLWILLIRYYDVWTKVIIY